MTQERLLEWVLGIVSAIAVALVSAALVDRRTAAANATRLAARVELLEAALVTRTGEIADLKAADREQRALIDELRDLATKVALLWKMMETQALGALHHSTQYLMDDMLEGYAAGTLSMDQLRQFIQRLRVIASGEAGAPEQVPAAEVTLVGAEEQLALRLQHPEAIDSAKQALRDESDRRMAVATQAESVPSTVSEVSTEKAGGLPLMLDPPEVAPLNRAG